MIADARLFSDKIPETIGHTGAHAKFLESLAHNEKFPHFIRGIRDKIHEAEMTGASPLHISLFCRAGEIRSVGCAILLSHCLEANGYCMARDINFMTKCFWRRNCCQGSCQWCWISGPNQLCSEAGAVRGRALFESEVCFGS